MINVNLYIHQRALAKLAPFPFLSDEYPVILKTQLGNTTVYTYLFTIDKYEERFMHRT